MAKEKSVKNLLFGIFMLVVGVWILVYSFGRIADDNEAETDTDVSVSDDSSVVFTSPDGTTEAVNNSTVSQPAEETVSYSHKANLVDVTDGQDIQGINTSGNASGVAQSIFEDGTYRLIAEFNNLPEPVGDSFYEGWLVEYQTANFFSTGVVEKDEDGVYINTFTDSTDWNQTHTFYVLTLEPSDGDPAPADHIVEALLEQ